jgi:hypothetical protein
MAISVRKCIPHARCLESDDPYCELRNKVLGNLRGGGKGLRLRQMKDDRVEYHVSQGIPRLAKYSDFR